jgi:tRNA threonylcarbamoyladenosine biosynthesis protein TsaB
MTVLAVDTSHPEGSVALMTDGEATSSAKFGSQSSHLVELGRCVDRLLRERGLRADDLERVALVKGPGSFTGLRVGMAYVKGLAAALGVEVVTVGTLELLAMPLLGVGSGGEPDGAPGPNGRSRAASAVCPLVDARKGEVYAAVYGAGSGGEAAVARAGGGGEVGGPSAVPVLVEPRAQAPETFLETARRFDPLFVGTGVIRYRRLVEAVAGRAGIAPESAAFPSTVHLCRVAPSLVPLSSDAVRSLEPTYIRPSGAALKRLKPIDPNG